MKEAFAVFNFNVRIEVEDVNDDEEVRDKVLEWWVSTSEIPDFEINGRIFS